MFHRFAQFNWQTFHEKRVGFKDAEKIIWAGLTIAEDGEGIWVVTEGYT